MCLDLCQMFWLSSGVEPLNSWLLSLAKPLHWCMLWYVPPSLLNTCLASGQMKDLQFLNLFPDNAWIMSSISLWLGKCPSSLSPHLLPSPQMNHPDHLINKARRKPDRRGIKMAVRDHCAQLHRIPKVHIFYGLFTEALTSCCFSS